VYQDVSSSRIVTRLTTLFPSMMLEYHAEEHGVFEREGKLQIPAFVWTFVFSFATGESRTPATFRRSYNSTADKTLTAGSFYYRYFPNESREYYPNAAK